MIRLVLISFLLFAAQLAVTPSYAQSTGEIRLQVHDPSGAALQASGHIAGPGTNRTFQTDARGAYSLDGLTFGRYRLDISRAGFAPRSVTIEISSATPVSQAVTFSSRARRVASPFFL
ncbi:carboxypeptidase-like regulatory domain-containing protein [Tunturiibacter gelidoferens]|uniref:Carboxypeptidase regulatory-like domain-containing protein n=1 Tax=Tunturiibacter gelidiferens TaxID=3069689 RepID=A0A9X0U224_9BACT|nr:carboxypeptidase-like regulatory domain-containing protein [Edaphobacter lichenicola]MBB5326485.1 hypothetical protein [Edaphobacter lichenicola]